MTHLGRWGAGNKAKSADELTALKLGNRLRGEEPLSRKGRKCSGPEGSAAGDPAPEMRPAGGSPEQPYLRRATTITNTYKRKSPLFRPATGEYLNQAISAQTPWSMKRREILNNSQWTRIEWVLNHNYSDTKTHWLLWLKLLFYLFRNNC